MADWRNSTGVQGNRPERHEADAALLVRIRRGEAAAFEELVEQYGRELYRVALGLLGNAADAEDAVQETFAGAFEGIGRFRGEASIRTWLSRILVRQAARVRRKKRSGIGSILKLWGERLEEPEHPETGSAAGQVERQMDVRAMLQSLSEEHRQVMVLRELEGLSYGEIASALGIPQGTVESRLYRARQELKKQFEGYERDGV